MRYWLSLCLLATAFAANPKPLGIDRIVFSQFDDGPPIPADYDFVPGDTVYLSFHVNGFKAVGDEDPRLSLTYTIEVQDPAGVPLIEAEQGTVDTTIVAEDKDWSPKVRLKFLLPPFAPSGKYPVKILIRDRVAQTQTGANATVRVSGYTPEPAESLVVRKFHFYRGEEDTKPLQVAAYKGGDSVWARFEIAGFKFGPKNAFDVSYGLQLLRPNGESLFRQDEAANEKQASFYPQRLVPAGLSLNLDKDIKPGEYTLVVLVNDKVGNQKIEHRQTFTVE